MKILIVLILAKIALAAGELYRGGWTYVPTDRSDAWHGKQYEFKEGGQNFVVKNGITYRQAMELGKSGSGWDWAKPENWENRPRTRVVKARIRK